MAAGENRFEADHVVVTVGAYQRPRIPSFAADLDPGILQPWLSGRHPGQVPFRPESWSGRLLLLLLPAASSWPGDGRPPLSPDPERAPARATLDYDNQVGDP